MSRPPIVRQPRAAASRSSRVGWRVVDEVVHHMPRRPLRGVSGVSSTLGYMPTGVQLTSRSQPSGSGGHGPALPPTSAATSSACGRCRAWTAHRAPPDASATATARAAPPGAENRRARACQIHPIPQRMKEAIHVGVVRHPPAVDDADGVDGTDAACDRIDLVDTLEQRDLVRNRHARAADRRSLGQMPGSRRRRPPAAADTPRRFRLPRTRRCASRVRPNASPNRRRCRRWRWCRRSRAGGTR